MPRHTVHIVDDDPQVCESVAFMLETQGFATTCHDGAATFLARLTIRSSIESVRFMTTGYVCT